jgi:glyoxylase-like metal-dependent hydrolase (beta-lactamase superfamily II)
MRLKEYDGFWQATFLPHLFPINVYLVNDGDGLILVDTGIPPMARGVLAAARRIGQPIERIALTHAHYDHVGSLDRLTATLPSALEVICSEREAAILAGDATARPDERATVDGELPGRFEARMTVPTRLVGDGDGIGPLVAVATPGHTPGSLSYWHERSGTLFAGDAWQTRAGLSVAGDSRPFFPFVARATWNASLAVTSARTVAQTFPISQLACGHGEVLPVVTAQLDAVIARAAAKAGLMEGAVQPVVEV